MPYVTITFSIVIYVGQSPKKFLAKMLEPGIVFCGIGFMCRNIPRQFATYCNYSHFTIFMSVELMARDRRDSCDG